MKFVFGSSANSSKGSDSLKPTATVQEHVGDSSRDYLEFHEPKTNSSNEEISLYDSHDISESSKCVRLGYCPKRIKMNGSSWTRTALEDEVFKVNKAMRWVSKTSGLMSNEPLYLFTTSFLMNRRESSIFYLFKPSLRLRYIQSKFKRCSLFVNGKKKIDCFAKFTFSLLRELLSLDESFTFTLCSPLLQNSTL